MSISRTLAFLLLATLAACATDPASSDDAASADGEDGPVYEEDTSTADELSQAHRVESLRPVTGELRALIEDLAPVPGFRAPKLKSGAVIATLRQLRLDGVEARVVVDVNALVTSVVPSAAWTNATTQTSDDDAPWLRAHERSAPDAYVKLSETRAEDGATEIAISIDMCQSSRAWNKNLYDELSRLGDVLGTPVPIGIAMTGGWARAHAAEFSDLQRRASDNLAVEWINHSNTHPLHCTDSSQRTCHFLTDQSVDFQAEVLGLEQVLLARGEVAGPLFRFPGLVHDARRLGQLDDLGLFALDANAWLAKGQPVVPGSVILVHGNGNEPPGIQKVMTWLRDHKSELETGKTRFVSPRYVLGPVPDAP